MNPNYNDTFNNQRKEESKSITREEVVKTLVGGGKDKSVLLSGGEVTKALGGQELRGPQNYAQSTQSQVINIGIQNQTNNENKPNPTDKVVHPTDALMKDTIPESYGLSTNYYFLQPPKQSLEAQQHPIGESKTASREKEISDKITEILSTTENISPSVNPIPPPFSYTTVPLISNGANGGNQAHLGSVMGAHVLVMPFRPSEEQLPCLNSIADSLNSQNKQKEPMNNREFLKKRKLIFQKI